MFQGAEECIKVLVRLPRVEVTWEAPRPLPAKPTEDGGPSSQEYQLEVHLSRTGRSHGSGAPRVYAPYFPKVPHLTYCCQ